jgi:hypothetical protein
MKQPFVHVTKNGGHVGALNIDLSKADCFEDITNFRLRQGYLYMGEPVTEAKAAGQEIMNETTYHFLIQV